MMSRDSFRAELTKIYKEYNVQFITGDFNAMHPRWCSSHESNRRGTQLLHLIRNFPEHQIHAPQGHTFEAVACRAKGTKRTSTVDLVISKDTITEVKRITGYLTSCSDHYPIMFTAIALVEKAMRPRRVAKTLLQFQQLRATIGLLYELSVRKPAETLRNISRGEKEILQTADIRKAYTVAEKYICEPWIARAKQKRRR